ncbi:MULTISPECIES: response regulator [Ureibacillus]|uniref:Two-component system response regulator (Stage 0 sporulation protein F) n=1 Tax=Ureibacillus thermosphaericus TaxID=51173 RepID=A0A840PNK9_URETH|nr:response regulator [Ureibacillus thermosphaericus]MBB5150005.1 two-component system response regulator (stage 0 sporulation protein F) [Ureibacillus thermosphaericus]NKZ32664.1 response regulator [Ureibacillus thermosphaericus]
MKKILIVDDQRGIRMLLDEIFKREGVKTYLASNGPEALQLIENSRMDGVLLDMKLPGIDGKEILRKIKTLYPEMPVFIMSAYEEAEMVKQANCYGADYYFTKPFNIFELKDAVIKMINRKKVLSE